MVFSELKFRLILFFSFLGQSLLANHFIIGDSLGVKDSSWQLEFSFGFDFSQLLHINPQQGAGQNKLSFNSAVGFSGKYNKEHINWENELIWQFGAQRVGRGSITPNLNIPVPFQKSMDDFRVNSKLGYRFREDSNWLTSINFGFRTLLVPTFNGDERLAGNFFKDIFTEGIAPSSKFFSPGIFTLAIGGEYQKKEGVSIFYSPGSIKCIVVANDLIAATGIHGNNTEGLPDSLGFYEYFENFNFQFGSLIRGSIEREIFRNWLKYQGSLILFSNYLNNPQNIDIDMVNTFNWNFYKNLNFTLMVNLFYDDDVLVQISDRNAYGGTNKLGRRISITQQFLVTYQVKF